MRRLVLAVVAAFVGATGARAQEASTAVVPETITVGDVFHAAVRVDVPAGAEVAFPDTLGLAGDDIETASRVRIAVDTIGGAQRITAAYPLTAWRAGNTLQLPALTYAVNEGGRQTLHTAAFPEFVLSSVLPADTAGIEPQPARDVWGANRVWWPWLLAAAVLLLAGLIAFYLWRRRRPAVVETVAPPTVSPREAALTALAEVRAAHFVERGEHKQFYISLSAIVRTYLERVDGEMGTDLTTSEITAEVRRRGAPGALLELLRLLGTADLVKFARARPGPADAYADLDAATRWVESYDGPYAAPVVEERAA